MPTDPTVPFQHTAPADVVRYFGTDAAAAAQVHRNRSESARRRRSRGPERKEIAA